MQVEVHIGSSDEENITKEQKDYINHKDAPPPKKGNMEILQQRKRKKTGRRININQLVILKISIIGKW